MKALPEPNVPSNTVTYFLKEALRRTWTSKRTSFVAIIMIAISLFVLGSFLLVADNLGRAVERWQGHTRVIVYLNADVTPEQQRAVDAFFGAHPELASRHFVDKQEALQRFKTYFTNLAEVAGKLDENPFPPSFEIEIDPNLVQSKSFLALTERARTLPGVDQVEYDWEWTRRLHRIIELLNVIGIAAGGVLAMAAAFTIANVIRLTMMLYREEIEIMRLVGATERMIRGPFLLEGLLQGTIGGAVAVGVLALAFFAGQRTLAPSSSLLWGFLFGAFLPWQKIVALILGGTVAGWFGSWLSVHQRAEEA
ncbi:MAG TPA: permease-like cell division protein FtsX [Thermoanaerobaculia bacterium]|nr:permease-like cell division protein FtsX [Thermoanaerobaculia bacterium]